MKKMYAIVSSYAGCTAEEFEAPAHDIVCWGYTDNIATMRDTANQLFQRTISDDLNLHQDYYNQEELEELRAKFEIDLRTEEQIKKSIQRQADDPISDSKETNQILIGTLYNYNERFEYVDSIIVAAIPMKTI